MIDHWAKLADCWGENPVLLDHPWIDTQGIPSTVEEYEPLLKMLSPAQLFVRVAGSSPDQDDPERRLLNGEGPSLASRMETEGLHILGVGLNTVSAEFQGFLDRFLEGITPILQRHGVKEAPEASMAVFLSCPNCVVPFHADPEHNFLFQLQGTKRFHIYPNNDLELFPSLYRERLVTTKKCVLPYQEEFDRLAYTMQLRPGSATYQPPMAPHWVESDDNVNISLAVSVYTDEERKLKRVLTFNNKLRRLNLQPQDHGRHPWLDSAKDLVLRALGKGSAPHFDS